MCDVCAIVSSSPNQNEMSQTFFVVPWFQSSRLIWVLKSSIGLSLYNAPQIFDCAVVHN